VSGDSVDLLVLEMSSDLCFAAFLFWNMKSRVGIFEEKFFRLGRPRRLGVDQKMYALRRLLISDYFFPNINNMDIRQ